MIKFESRCPTISGFFVFS